MKATENEWGLKLKTLYTEAERIKDTGLWEKVLAHCEATSRTLRTQAGAAATDRDMNRIHGRADAYAEMLTVMNDVVESYAAAYERRMEEEDESDGGTGADGSGREFDSLPDTATFKDRRRISLYTTGGDEED